VVVQTAPAVRVSLGEEFGMEPGSIVTGKLVAALRALGFDAVFDTDFTADLTIVEEGNELLKRMKKGGKLPMLTSCSPGWINFIEQYYPEQLPHVSTCKSPQQMFGALAKTYYAKKIGKRPEDIFVVSIMPCTAKKYEAQRPEMASSGVRDVDVVLTTRELGRMIKQAGIDFRSLPDDTMDSPLGMSSGAADIFANTGGVMEAALRTAYEIVTERPFPFENLHVGPIAGLEGVKEASIQVLGAVPAWSFLEGATLKVAVAHGLGNAEKVLQRIKAGEAEYHFIEVMTCPGGCINGGGQPRSTSVETIKARMQTLYAIDRDALVRASYENPGIRRLYAEFLGKPLSHRSHELLHTQYERRDVVV
jgi:NADP-reducing hydrogenase subunit HndD